MLEAEEERERERVSADKEREAVALKKAARELKASSRAVRCNCRVLFLGYLRTLVPH